MGLGTIVLIWIAVSFVVGIVVGMCIRFGMGDDE